MWLNDVDLKGAWEGWFYKEGKYLIMIEPASPNDCDVAIINKAKCKIFVENYSLPQDLKPLFLIDPEGIFDES